MRTPGGGVKGTSMASGRPSRQMFRGTFGTISGGAFLISAAPPDRATSDVR
jgi:hypothetical protein